MVIQRGPGLALFGAVCLLATGYFTASRLGWLDQLQAWLWPGERVGLSAGDFPAGISAPVEEVASIPLRPTRIGFTPRGSAAALLLATGGAVTPDDTTTKPAGGLLQSAYVLDARAVVYAREEDLRRALSLGGDAGGVDLAAITVDCLARWAVPLRDAAPRTLLLLGRSRGQEALAAVGVPELRKLAGKRLAAYPQGPAYYFALWLLSRERLGPGDVHWVELRSSLDAGRVLREGKADAVVGLTGDVELAARDRGGKVLATTVDAPHLVTSVLVTRGDFAARYPDAIRRLLRGLLDAAASLGKDSTAGARLLGEVAPYLGDPQQAIRDAPAASLSDNLTFFGLSGEAPVTYDELFESAGALFQKVGKSPAAVSAEGSRDLGPLQYVAKGRRL